MPEPYVVKWGILATGENAKKFTTDLLLDPRTRGETSIQHLIVAAASSRSTAHATAFLKTCGVEPSATAHGSYESLAADPEVSIIYIATPHSEHFRNALLCLQAGKHVLLEKAFTVNAAQARVLVEVAQAKNCFLMEALWTRFFPLTTRVRELMSEGAIGKVQRVVADRSLGRDIEVLYGTEHRLINANLAGGALLDLGIYSLTWVFQILYHLQSPELQERPSIVSSMIKYPPTGVDESVSMIATFPALGAQGIATANIRVTVSSPGPDVRIYGTKGEIQIFGTAARPLSFKIIPKGNPQVRPEDILPETFDIPGGSGYFWEGDECGRCLRDKKLESKIMPLDETVLMMDVMDEVRRQSGLVYSDILESYDI